MARDPVNHPPHYVKGSIETIDALEGLKLDDDFCLAKAFCYIARCRYKDNLVQDLEKAIWYLNRRIRQEKGRRPPD